MRAETRYTYTTKVDIWAISCILYELVFHKKAFADDLAVAQYCVESEMARETLKNSMMPGGTMLHVVVSDIVLATLDVDEGKRPRAENLRAKFSNEDMATLSQITNKLPRRRQ